MAIEVGIMAAQTLSEVLLGTAGTFATFEAAKEAYDGVGVDTWGSTGVTIGTAKKTEGGPADSISSTSLTPIEVAEQNDLNATDAKVNTAAVAFVEGDNNDVKVAGLTAIDTSMALATAAPVLGVSIDADLSETNPTLFQKCINALKPFAYYREDTGTYALPLTNVPMIVGGAVVWTVGMLKKAIDALKEVFDEEGIGPAGYSSDLDTGVWTQPLEVHTTPYEVSYLNQYGQTMTWSAGSSTPGRLCTVGYYYVEPNYIGLVAIIAYPVDSGGYEHNGKMVSASTAFRGLGLNAQLLTPVSQLVDNTYASYKDTVGWTMVYGSAEGVYPAGTSQWEGTTPSTIPTTNRVIVGIDDFGANIYEDMVPVSVTTAVPDNYKPDFGTPSGSVASNDPVVYPDTNVTTNPDKQVDPYIMSTPLPWVNTIPEVTIYDIFRDPSIARELDIELVDTQELALEAYPMVPSGVSPNPLMPGGAGGAPLPFSSGGGLVTVYHPTDTELYSFEQWLWVTFSDATIDKIWNNPFDGVISLFELYCTPTDAGNRNIHCGFLDSGINSAIISRYTQINCGTLGIPEYFGTYFDYSPYTKAHIYLPFIGIQELNPDDIVGHAVNVTYRIDEYNGSCIAMITVAKSTEVNGEEVEYTNTTYQFSGNCAVELPLSGGSQAAIKAGMMQADAWQTANQVSVGATLVGGIASALMGVMTGSPAFLTSAVGAAGSAASAHASGKANYLSNMLSGKSTVSKSGSFGSSHGALGIKKPYITITRPKQIIVPDYNKLYGYPAHKMVQVGACEGFIRCREVHVISATATDGEKTMIEQFLRSGVYINEQE